MSIASEITRLQSAKSDIKSAIEAKGVTVPSSASISTYDDYVAQIQTGGGGSSADTAILIDLIERDIISIDIPNGVTSIGNYVFYGCSGLTSVTIPSGVTSIGNYAFYDCSGLTSVTIPNGVTSIGNSAFRSCDNLTSITIPDSVTSIGEWCFQYCSLTSVTIPSGVTSIENYTFQSCSGLTSVIIGSGVTSIGSNAFRDCSSLTSITIPNSVTSIAGSAFNSCSGLTSVIIGSGVTSIGSNAFSGATGALTVNCNIPNSAFTKSNFNSVTIGDNVTSIGNYAFSGCSSLTSSTIGSGVTSIGMNAFNGCSGLTSITIEATTPPTLGINVFIRTNDCPIYVPAESVNAYKSASDWSYYADRIFAIPSPTPPTPQCQEPENMDIFEMDGDFNPSDWLVYQIWVNSDYDLNQDGSGEAMEYEGYVVLSSDGSTPQYTLASNITNDGNSSLDICEYDGTAENYAGTVLSSLSEADDDILFVGFCDYFNSPMYVVDYTTFEYCDDCADFDSETNTCYDCQGNTAYAPEWGGMGVNNSE